MSEPMTAPGPSARTATVLMSVAVVVWGLGGVVAIPVAMFSPMMFDAPGSNENAFTRLLFWAVCTFPAVALLGLTGAVVGAVMAQRAAKAQDPRRLRRGTVVAAVSAALPLLSVLAGVVGLVLLEVYCGGRFAC